MVDCHVDKKNHVYTYYFITSLCICTMCLLSHVFDIGSVSFIIITVDSHYLDLAFLE